MFIDLVLGVCLVFGLVRGFMRGLILAVFSFFALILGIVCALKFTHIGSLYLKQTLGWDQPYMPLVTFLLIFIGVLVVIHVISRVIHQLIKFIQLGFFNKLAGAIMLGTIYGIIGCTLIWMGDQLQFLGPETKKGSITYKYVAHLAPDILDFVAGWMPWFRDLFDGLERFFKSLV